MAHSRYRFSAKLLQEKLHFAPIVAIQGVRQCGKSFLARELLPKIHKNSQYETFDDHATLEFADRNPKGFLEQSQDFKTLIIDEAQKVPKIFDTIKLFVDRKRIPGKYLLLGSTEFSTLFKIRESLTGRMSRIRLFPFTAAELYHSKAPIGGGLFFSRNKPIISRGEFLKLLEKGGMPGMFSVRKDSERESLISDWIDLTCSRDLLQIKSKALDSHLAYRILELLPQLKVPDATSLGKSLRKDVRVVQRHLDALQSLFIVNVLEPHPTSSGKKLYFLCDVSFANYFGGSLEIKIWTWLVHELSAKLSFIDDRRNKLYYYRNPKGSLLHAVLVSKDKTQALRIHPEESVVDQDLRLLRSFCKSHIAEAVLLAGSSQTREGVKVLPWENMA